MSYHTGAVRLVQSQIRWATHVRWSHGCETYFYYPVWFHLIVVHRSVGKVKVMTLSTDQSISWINRRDLWPLSFLPPEGESSDHGEVDVLASVKCGRCQGKWIEWHSCKNSDIMATFRSLRYRKVPWRMVVLFLLTCGLVYYFVVYRHNSPWSKRSDSDSEILTFRRNRFRTYQQNERSRVGPGENGEPLNLEGDEKQRGEELYKKEAFNIVASDKISVERSLRDNRDPK